MILSAYVNTHFISVVVFDEENFNVDKKAYIKIPLEFDPFFEVTSINQINNLIMQSLNLSEDDFNLCTKFIITDKDSSDTAYGYTRHFFINQIIEAVAGRIAFFDVNNYESAFQNDRTLLNRYMNQKMYRAEIDLDLCKPIFDKISDGYLKLYSHPKDSLLEVIVSTPEFDEDKKDSAMEMIIESFANSCFQNKIIEFTFDFGAFLIPIIATIIDRKEDPKMFFVSNPIHIDSKLVTIPGLLNNISVKINNEDAESVQKDSGLQYLSHPEEDNIIIDSTEQKRKVHLEILGARKGVYLDTRAKNDQ